MNTDQQYDKTILDKCNVDEYFEKGQYHYSTSDFGAAINDFNSALAIDPNHGPSRAMLQLIESILSFRNLDMYNP